MRKPIIQYRIIARLISPLWLIHTTIRSFKDGGRPYFLQRLGVYPTDEQPRIWIHAASVGEVNTVLPLIHAVRKAGFDNAILLTTNTPTGRQISIKRMPEHCIHRYLPVDLPGACRRFLKHHQISQAWIMETEIWPWLYSLCQDRELPITIINARLTEKTLAAKKTMLGAAYADCLAGVKVLAKDADEAHRYQLISNGEADVTVCGNLKFSGSKIDTYRQSLIDTPYCVAASTHDDEELQLATAWLEAGCKTTLVIVPRHPERGPEIRHKLRHLKPVPLRSNDEALHGELYIADTLGELEHWYAHATAVFIGGSLIDRGGQNLLEAVRYAKLVIAGPSMYNFKDETALLENAHAILRCQSAIDAVQLLVQAIEDPEWASEFGELAREIASQHANVADHYVANLLPVKEL